MSRVLVIESSARQRGSVSRLLTAEFISHWKIAHPADCGFHAIRTLSPR